MTTLQDDLNLLGRAGLQGDEIAHALEVRELTLALAARVTAERPDMDLLARAALFHDLGKAVTPSVLHGVEGARLGASLGLAPKLCEVMERHVRAGVPLSQCDAYGLPPKDYQARDLADRLIIVTGKLARIIQAGAAAGLDEAWRDFPRILQKRPDLYRDESTLLRYLGHYRQLTQAMEHPHA